jgi:Obg family GTPase CgtA-like protein
MEVFASISAATTAGIRGFLNKLLPIVLEERAKRQAVSLQPAAHSPTILRPHLESPRAEAFVIEEHPRGIFRVRGRRLQQIAQMTDWSSPGAVQRFRDIAERSGLLRALHRAGADASSQVLLGDVDVSSHWL